LGVNRFKALSKLTNKNIVALGGISGSNKRTLKNLKIREFAGISYFK